MARSRRGSFGLKPRVAPNVTGQIVALAREYVAKRDALIMDAWRSGGTFEGKKATDDMVLAYWKERGRGLSKDDPEYENAKNQIQQLTYAVEQSKMDLRHAQGKISDMQYAQFFLKWSNKVPKNSEFYRVLQKDAAHLIESAKAKSRAAGEKARVESFNAFVKSTTERSIAIGDAMTQALSSLSKETGLSITANGDELLNLLTQDVDKNPGEYGRLLDTIKKGDPDWNGQLTPGYFSQHIKAATRGYELIADRAGRDGFMSAYTSATQGMSSMSQWGQNLRVWPVAHTYTDTMNLFNKVMNDPNSSQMDKLAAGARASQQLMAMSETPGIDAGSKTMLQSDAQRLIGVDAGDNPSFGAAMLGREGITPQVTMQLGAWSTTKMTMEQDPTAWAYAPVDSNGQFDPTGRGPLGMVPAGSVQPGAQAVMVPGRDGKAVMAMVMPHSVYTVDPNKPNASPTLAGYEISYNVGGRLIQMWGYKDDRGGNHWSLNSPLQAGAAMTTNDKGDVFVTPPALPAVGLPQQIASLKDPAGNPLQLTPEQQASLAAGGSIKSFSDTRDVDKQNGIVQTVTLSVKDGYLVSTTTSEQWSGGVKTGTTTTPTQLTAPTLAGAYSPSALAAGNIPGVTFDSAMQASVKAAAYTQTQDQIAKFASDPAFQQAFLSQTMETLGTTNPFDPRIAAAWRDVTTPTPVGQMPMYRDDKQFSAAARNDLLFPGPGESTNPAYDKEIKVNFGGQELRIPGLPSYLQNQQATIGQGGSAAGWATASPWANLVPGLGLPQIPKGTPSAVIPSPSAVPSAVKTTPPPAPMPVITTPPPTAPPTPTTVPGVYRPPGLPSGPQR